MPFHPNPVSMAIHVEHHRQELLDQAQQERMAKEAIDGAPKVRHGRLGVFAAIASGIQAVASKWRPTLVEPMELPQSTPGEAT